MNASEGLPKGVSTFISSTSLKLGHLVKPATTDDADFHICHKFVVLLLKRLWDDFPFLFNKPKKRRIRIVVKETDPTFMDRSR